MIDIRQRYTSDLTADRSLAVPESLSTSHLVHAIGDAIECAVAGGMATFNPSDSIVIA